MTIVLFLAGLVGLIATEVFIGFALGVMLRLTIWMLTIAGSVILPICHRARISLATLLSAKVRGSVWVS